MSDQWGQPGSQRPGYGQQAYQSTPQSAAGQPAPPQQPEYLAQPQQQPGQYYQQPLTSATTLGGSSKKGAIVGGLIAVAVIGGGLGIYLATNHTGSSPTVQSASTAGISPGASATSAQPSATATAPAAAGNSQASTAAGGQRTADLLTTNQVCPSFLAIEQPLIKQMGQITDEASGARVFETFQPKFDALASSTPTGAYKTQIQSVASDLDAIVAYIKANPHMPRPAPAAFDTELNALQNDSDTVDNNCDPLGGSTS